MPDATPLWRRLLAGRRLWPWQWQDVVASATAEHLRALAEALATLPSAGQQLAAGEALLRLLVEEGCRPLATNDETIGWLVAALSPADLYWSELNQQAQVRQTAEDLLGVLAPASYAALRALLRDPPSQQQASRADWARERLTPRNVALRLLEGTFSEADLDLLDSLWRSDAEADSVRSQAIELYLRWCGPERALATVPYLIARYSGPGALRYSVPETTRAALVQPLIEALQQPGPNARWRPHWHLIDCGEPAVAPLAALIRGHADELVRRFAQTALGHIDPAALAAALAANAGDEVGLSPAAPPETDAERGLSTAACPQADSTSGLSPSQEHPDA